METPKNIPAIDKVVKHYAYREWRYVSGLTRLYHTEYQRNDEVHKLEERLACVTSPEHPHRHIDNHHGWEVVLKNDKRAVFMYSDWCLYVWQLPDN